MKSNLVTAVIAGAVGAIVGIAAILVLRDGDNTAADETDIVVGVVARCEFRDFGSDVRIEASGERCEGADRSIGTGGKFNSRLELTVRTSEGETYKVEVPPDTPIQVGDSWP